MVLFTTGQRFSYWFSDRSLLKCVITRIGSIYLTIWTLMPVVFAKAQRSTILQDDIMQVIEHANGRHCAAERLEHQSLF